MITNTASLNEQSIILWADGGSRPNPGNTGWGVHGYLYENIKAKKGAGNPTHVPTKIGYITKTERDKTNEPEVKVISYFDGFGSSLIQGTNNVAELLGATAAFRKAADYAIKDIILYTDSQYTQKGLLEWSPIWLKRNWIRADGTPVPNADYWKDLLSAWDALKNRGVETSIQWVKAHSDNKNHKGEINLGNVMADRLATTGVMFSTKKMPKTEFKVCAAEGYWKSEVEKHPFISNRRMYFNTLIQSHITGEYYLGEHGKDDDLLGKKISDGAYCVVQMKEPDVILEAVRAYQSEIAGNIDSIVLVRLDKLYNPGVYKELKDYGIGAMVRANKHSLDLNCLDEEPLTKELRPVGLAMRAIESLSELGLVLEKFQKNDSSLQVKDITNIFYDTEIKIKKNIETKSLKFKTEYNVGFCALPLVVDVPTETGVCNLKLTLTLGIDLLDRNALKRLEALEPKVSLVLWKETPTVCRYVTIIESQGNYGIWGGVYSNILFIA